MNAILSASQMHVKDRNRGRIANIQHYSCGACGSSSEPTKHRRLSLRNNHCAEETKPKATKQTTGNKFLTEHYEPSSYLIKHDCIWKKRNCEWLCVPDGSRDLIKSSSTPNIHFLKDGEKKKQQVFQKIQQTGTSYCAKKNRLLGSNSTVQKENALPKREINFTFKETSV